MHRLCDTEVEYFGAAVDVGSRDDPEGYEGLAHFVEHVLFKGTTKRRSWHIINRMEACGGELNAYTTKETTVVYSIFPSGNLSRAAELIADLLCHSTFPQTEIDKEREVVADEISQYRDIPSEAVFDDFEDLIFSGSSLGHNILGSRRALDKFDSAVCRNYLRLNFTAKRIALFYSGPLSLNRVEKLASRLFSDIPATIDTPQRVAPPEVDRFDSQVSLGSHQANTVIGLRTVSLHSMRRWPIALLTNIVGGPGMNSLLNVELRERRGLVYSVEASSATLTDTGLFTVFFGCDHSDLNRCRRIVNNVIDRIAQNGLTDRFLDKAKRQYLGQLTLATDVRDSSVMSMARSALYRGAIMSREEATATIMEITSEQIRQEAEFFIASGMNTLSLL